MSRIPAHLLAVVRCRTCGSRNATDAWRRLRGARAKCGRCGGPLPLKIPWGILAPSFAIGALALALAGWGVSVWKQRSADRLAEAVREEIAAGRHEEAAERLLEGGATAARRREAAAAIASELLARAEAEPDRAESLHRQGDALMARHAGAWPELVRELAAPLEQVAEIREAAAFARRLEERSERSDERDGSAFEREWAEGLEQSRRWGPFARELFAERAERAWAALRLGLARGLVDTSPASSAEWLRRPGPERARRPVPVGSETQAIGPKVEEPEPPSLGPEDSLRRLDEAIAAGELDLLASAVRLRAGESWGAGERARLDERLRTACVAMASTASTLARAESDPLEAARLWERALTCDEVLPVAFRREALAALAIEQLAAAGDGRKELPSAERLEVRLPARLLDPALGVLACLAERAGEPELAIAALERLRSDEALSTALRCESVLPTTPEARLDYPSGDPGERR